MTYGDFKDLLRRTIADEILHDKDLMLLKIQNMIDINTDLFQWFINCLIRRLLV